MRGQAVLTVGLFLTVAAPAGAATVQGTASCGKENCVYGLVFRASPGERNVVTTERAAPNAVIFRDAGAPIALGRGCQAQGDGSVRCVNGTVNDALSVEVHLGDGDDVGSGDGFFYGEAGNDRITGNGSGGPGDDVLMNQRGFFSDDDGANAGHDVYRSWDGAGTVSYEGRRTGVRADLRPGQHSEDRLEGITSVTGGAGDDVLIGDDADNRLDGGGGVDRIAGHGGNDWIVTGRSDEINRRTEHVEAGPGDDRIDLGGGTTDTRCGPGVDTVRAGRLVRSDCERVGYGYGPRLVQLRAVLPSPGSAFLIDIPFCDNCTRDRWTATDRGEPVGSVSARRSPTHLRLNATGRRRLRREGRLRLEVQRRYRPGDTPFQRSVFTVEVRLR